jgi:endonuclease YncB( thermonuclease family)
MFKPLAICVLLCPLPAAAEVMAASLIYVIDGDTIDAKGDQFRLVGFDTPETYRPQCDNELALGRAATSRLRNLLEYAQRVDLVVLPGRDKYDRGLGRLLVQQVNVADTLVSEGLARRYNGGKRAGWCQ